MGPTNNYGHLWDELPEEQRKKLMPERIEQQIFYLYQFKQKAIKHHESHMKELDDWIHNLSQSLPNKEEV